VNIFFVSRAYPPITGGIENQNHGLALALGPCSRLTLLANGRGKRFLPFFLPWAFVRACLASRRHDVLLLGDGVLAPLGALVKRLAPRMTVVCVVHGLDISFATRTGWLPWLYGRVNLPALRRLDLLVAVGRATVETAVSAGVPRERVRFIPNGLFPEEFAARPSRARLEALLGMPLENRRVIVRIGRFVAHKGVEWFIRNVMPRLPEHVMLVAAGPRIASGTVGDADCYEACARAIVENGLEQRVRLMTALPWDDVKLLYATADIVVSPNVRIPGSMEGFGINVIEAAASGAPIVAARLDGLEDAVDDGCNGVLVAPEDADAFVRRIDEFLRDDAARHAFGDAACAYVREHFAWPIIAARYMAAFSEARLADP